MLRTSRTFRFAALAALVAAGLAVPLLPQAQSQLTATPRYLPIGVAAGGNFSTAWFHEPSSGKALACSTNASTGGAISCVAVQLPER